LIVASVDEVEKSDYYSALKQQIEAAVVECHEICSAHHLIQTENKSSSRNRSSRIIVKKTTG